MVQPRLDMKSLKDDALIQTKVNMGLVTPASDKSRKKREKRKFDVLHARTRSPLPPFATPVRQARDQYSLFQITGARMAGYMKTLVSEIYESKPFLVDPHNDQRLALSCIVKTLHLTREENIERHQRATVL